MIISNAPNRLLRAFLFLLVVSTVLTYGQVAPPRASLRGRVLDPNQAVVAGAQVSVEGKGRLSSVVAVTDQKGEFSLSLEPGEYTLRVTAPGFTEAAQAVSLSRADSGTTVEIVLQVAGATSTVTVTDSTGYQVEAVGSATRTLTPLRDIPQTITVVTREQIRDQSLQSITDVVTYVPGISSHQGEGNRDQIVIRGNSTTADFYLDGVRDDVQYMRDLYNLERVEALKGPNAMIFGRGGGGGIINRVTKEATFSPLREFTLQGGSFGNKRVTGDFGQPLGDKLAFRINGLYENSGSHRRFVGRERYGVNPTLTFNPSTRTRITFAYEYFHDGRTADRGIPSYQGRPVDIPISTFFGNPQNARVRADVNLLSSTVEHRVGRFNIRNRILFGDYDKFYQNYVPGAVTADRTRVSISAYNNATKRRNLFNQTDVTFAASTGRVRHNFLFGTELGRQLTDNFRNTGFFNNTSTSITAPLDNPVISTPITFRQIATDADNHVKTNLAAVYVQDQIELSRHVQVVAGLRYDYFDLQFHNNRNNQDLRRIDNLVSPRVGLIVKPVTPLSLYANYSVAYLPSSGDQFSSLTTITQQVKPEKFSNYEVGVKWDVRRYLTLTSALYRQDRTNTRSLDPNDPTRIIQTGSQRTNGFEVGLNGSLTRAWSVAGGYAYQDAFISRATAAARAGAQVAQVPHHHFSLWNNYRLDPRWALGLGLVHRSDMFAAVDNTVVLPGYTRADMAVFFNITEQWRLQANAENLFGTRYYINADGNNNISPGASRGVRVGLTARF
ncbi:MAG TPA: TonB-dependent siderophore receptor [Pyrinomonadaceae bacterium]|nr:TonB-dependent siderophore receptor [Pyrinomonadaceae bacterium]